MKPDAKPLKIVALIFSANRPMTSGELGKLTGIPPKDVYNYLKLAVHTNLLSRTMVKHKCYFKIKPNAYKYFRDTLAKNNLLHENTMDKGK